jgi:hypothetical protein
MPFERSKGKGGIKHRPIRGWIMRGPHGQIHNESNRLYWAAAARTLVGNRRDRPGCRVSLQPHGGPPGWWTGLHLTSPSNSQLSPASSSAPIQRILCRLALLRVPFSCYWAWPIYCLTGSLMSSQQITPCILFLVRTASACLLVNRFLNPMFKIWNMLKFGIYSNSKFCSNLKLFKTRNLLNSKICSNSILCSNPKNVQIEICSIWNLFYLKSVPFEICSIWNLFHSKIYLILKMFNLKTVQVLKLFNFKSVQIKKCSNWKKK